MGKRHSPAGSDDPRDQGPQSGTSPVGLCGGAGGGRLRDHGAHHARSDAAPQAPDTDDCRRLLTQLLTPLGAHNSAEWADVLTRRFGHPAASPPASPPLALPPLAAHTPAEWPGVPPARFGSLAAILAASPRVQQVALPDAPEAV